MNRIYYDSKLNEKLTYKGFIHKDFYDVKKLKRWNLNKIMQMPSKASKKETTQTDKWAFLQTI